jgi:2-polyprenyl-3-methyl-5-hydroxy-6-metoxy-1,4-benzoquinol methylase
MTACTACGAPTATAFEARDYNREVSREIFRYLRCTRCGLISLANAPADLGRYYAIGYHALPASEDDVRRGAVHESYKIELVRRFAAGGRLLEIGPSWGAFCLLAREAGFEVEAIEMDARCCEFLESRIGVRAIRSADEAAAITEATVPDVIALWHVIEHLRDPWALLARAAEHQRPGGLVVIATPNPAAFQYGLFGRRWTHVDAPRHLHLIPAEVLRQKMRALGYEELLCTTTDEGSLGWNDFGWRFSLASFGGTRVLKRALRFGGGLLARLFSPFESVEGRGSAYTSVFRKGTAGP